MTPGAKVCDVARPELEMRLLSFRIRNATGGVLRLHLENLARAVLAPGAGAGLTQRCPVDGCFDVTIGPGADGHPAVNVHFAPGPDGDVWLDLDGSQERLAPPYVLVRELGDQVRWPLGTTSHETFGATLDYLSIPHLERRQRQPEALLELPDGPTRPLCGLWVDGTSGGEPATLTVTGQGAALTNLDSFRCD
jgi:hypothetical protein